MDQPGDWGKKITFQAYSAVVKAGADKYGNIRQCRPHSATRCMRATADYLAALVPNKLDQRIFREWLSGPVKTAPSAVRELFESYDVREVLQRAI
jgi:hypothetical protein